MRSPGYSGEAEAERVRSTGVANTAWASATVTYRVDKLCEALALEAAEQVHSAGGLPTQHGHRSPGCSTTEQAQSAEVANTAWAYATVD